MKKILVALDGSPRAEIVLAQAVALAGLTGSKLVLFRSFGLPPHMPDHVWALPEGSLMEALRVDSAKYLDQCARAVPRETLAGTRVELGVPWQAVCAAAQSEDVDMVIIGSHGYGGVDHLIGTTAAKIVNHIDRPVLVVRPTAKPKVAS
jgi:nucleotide-binding universal stress UspA family protein